LGECSFCGYAVPDTEKLSAVYDLSPDNVTFADYDDGDELTPIDTPDATLLPTAKQVRDAAKRRRAEERKKSQVQNAGGANNAVSAGPVNIANNANVPFVPYAKPNYGNPSKPVTSGMPETVVKTVSNFVIHHWWKFLLTLILPSIGYGFAFFYFVINRDKDNERKISELFFAGAILLTTILLQAVKWDPTGLDLLIQYLISEYLTRGRYHRY
ncbi:MAG: hypothetical protein K2N71_12410, partial [Oscillospiraceae bacterium]|nr:hypothetical protein [Oscillospiraceae bacterium]